MRFLESPLVIGITGYFIYMTFELFARRQERMKLIEKIGQNLAPVDSSVLKFEFSSLLPTFKKKSSTSLRIGSLFVGIGLGLLVGLWIDLYIKISLGARNDYLNRDVSDVAYLSSVLLFGGLGLLISYFIESRATKKE